MKEVTCAICKSKMKRNGFTSSGRQRWKCLKCGSSKVHTNDVSTRELKAFVNWLLSRERHRDKKGQGRTFRRHTKPFWEIWPIPIPTGEVHKVIYVDGTKVGDYQLLIACTDEYVLNWIIAESENKTTWMNLIQDIPAPEMVVCDGGSGFKSAAELIWPGTRIQRCIFHISSNIRKAAKRRPITLAARELLDLRVDLVKVRTLHDASVWVEDFYNWAYFWNDLLDDVSYVKGKREYTFKEIRTVRDSLDRLIRQKMLFTYLDPKLCRGEKLPSTNNRIEGGVNAQIKEMLRLHRGMSTIRRIKACYWWCYMHSECPLSAPELLKRMPRDCDIDILKNKYRTESNDTGAPDEWGTGVQWNEFHSPVEYPYRYE